MACGFSEVSPSEKTTGMLSKRLSPAVHSWIAGEFQVSSPLVELRRFELLTFPIASGRSPGDSTKIIHELRPLWCLIIGIYGLVG